MVFKNGVKNIQAAAYNGVHTACLFKEEMEAKVNVNLFDYCAM